MVNLSFLGCMFYFIHSELDNSKNKFHIFDINNLQYSAKEFFNKINEFHFNIEDKSLDVFCIAVRSDKEEKIKSEIDRCFFCSSSNYDFITIDSFISNVKKFYEGNIDNINKKIINVEDVTFFFFSSYNDNQNFLDSTITTWFNHSRPILYGKQMLTQKYLLDDLNGRRIIGSLIDQETFQNYLLIEGGLKVYLDKDRIYSREEFRVDEFDFNIFTGKNVQNILMNPIYSFGRYFEPYELFLIWQKVLFYVLAISDIEINKDNIENIYNIFLDFVSNEVCDEISAETIISKDEGLQVILILIDNIKGYLKGKNESIISRDYILIIKNFYMFIEPLKEVFKDYKIFSINSSYFDYEYYKLLLEKVDSDKISEKGKSLENLIEYLFKSTKEFKVMAKRIKTDREEIDLSCVNISCNSKLWELGAFVLVESKNWKNKVDVNVIRQLGYISFYKGNTTCVLVARSGITRACEKEIHRLAVLGKYILVINLDELKTIESSNMFVDLIVRKYEKVFNSISNDFELLEE